MTQVAEYTPQLNNSQNFPRAAGNPRAIRGIRALRRAT